MDFVTIFKAFSSIDAQLVRSRLEAAGFHPFIADDLSAFTAELYSPAIGGIRVQIPEDEAPEARAFLDAP